MTAAHTQFTDVLSNYGERLSMIADYLLGTWIGEQSFSCNLMMCADRHTLKVDGDTATIQADLFAVDETVNSLRITIRGVRDDEDGWRATHAEIHAPTRLTVEQAIAANAAAADPRSAEMAEQVAALDADQLSTHCDKDLDALAEGWGPVVGVDVTPAVDTFKLDGVIASMEAGLVITFTGGRTVSNDILVTLGDPADPHSPPSIDLL